MEINITTTLMARTRTDLTVGAVRTPSLPCVGTAMSFTGGVGHFGGERVVDGGSDIKLSDNFDNRTGTDWSPPV